MNGTDTLIATTILTLTVAGAIYLEDSHVIVRCTCVRRGQRDEELDEITQPLDRDDLPSALARDIAHTVFLKFSNPDVISARDALGYVTEALREMPRITINSRAKQPFARPQAKLEAAMRAEDCPLVHFNLGIIHYFRYGKQENALAIKHFKRAARIDDHRLR